MCFGEDIVQKLQFYYKNIEIVDGKIILMDATIAMV